MYWLHDEDSQWTLSREKWLAVIDNGVDFLRQADFRSGGRLIRHGFAILTDQCRADADAFYVDLEQLAVHLEEWSRYGHNEVVRSLLAYLAGLSRQYLTPAHPQRVLVESPVQLQQLEAEIPLTQLTRSIMEASLPKWLPPSHPDILWFEYIKLRTDNSFDALAWIESVDDRCGMNERRTWKVVLWCSGSAFGEEDWALAESLWSFYLAHAAEDFDRMHGHLFLAYSQAQLENYNASAQSLREAYWACSFRDSEVACLHVVLLEWVPVLKWLCSISSDDQGIMQLQSAIRECEDRLHQLDDQECMELLGVFCSA